MAEFKEEKADPYEMIQKTVKSDPDYSVIAMGRMNSEAIYEVPATSNTGSGTKIGEDVKKGEDIKRSNKLICLVAMLVSVVMLVGIVAVGCFIALFLEVAKLTEQTPIIMRHLQQINISIEDRFEDFTDIQASKVQQLNESVISKIEEIVVHQNSKVQQLNTSIISSIDGIGNLLNNTVQQLNTSVNQNTDQLGIAFRAFHSFHPASCAALPPSSPSGYYWVGASIGSAVRVYCDTTRSCGGVTGGWRRVAGLDMTNSSQQCPSSLRQRTDSNKRTCGIPSTGCSSVTFSTATLEYSIVCGKIMAYQYGIPDAFVNANADGTDVDGVSLTHGNPRQHIWTFVAASDEVSSYPRSNCPCTNTDTASPPPAFVGNDYFCDTGSSGTAALGIFYGDNPLWDGAGCGPLNTCCSFNNPPWFYKQLPQPTTSDIEMTVCRTNTDEDIAVETVDIYVQ